MGNLHISIGAAQHYAYCPPASGPHYNNPGVDGPIPAKYYGPGFGRSAPELDPQPRARGGGRPVQLQHGRLYRRKPGALLQQVPVNFPDSPVCGIKGGVLAPVVARFDTMAAPFAALVWNRLLYMNTVDKSLIEQFYATEGETTNPEAQCARPSPSAAPSAGPSAVPSSSTAAPTAAPTAQPSLAPTASPS